MINQYIEKCKREFRQRFPDMYGILPNRVDLHGNKGQPVHSDAIKGFIESALLGLCEQLKKEIGKKKLLEVGVNPTALMWKQRFNNDIDEILHLLDYNNDK